MKWIHGFLGVFIFAAGAFVGWKIAEPKVALEEARRAWERQDMEACFTALESLAQSSARQAFEVVLSLEGNGDRQQALVRRLVEKAPQRGPELMAAFLQHPEMHPDFGMGGAAFLSCAQEEPERAWQAMLSQPGRFMPAVLPAIAEGLTRRDPQVALQYAEKVQSPVQRERFVSDVIQAWSDSDGQGLLKWLRAQPEHARLSKYVRWDRVKIAEASALADIAALLPKNLEEKSGLLSTPMLPDKADVWMRHTDWLLALPVGEMRTRLCTTAATGLADLDPEAALKLLPEIQEATVRRRVTSSVAAFRAAATPKEGLAFARELTDAEERRRAVNAALFTWAENDPEDAVRHAQESGDAEAKIMLSHAGSQMAMKDAEKASRFALENEPPPDPKKSHGETYPMLKSAVNIWAGREPVAAGRWVKALPEGAQKDTALAAVASALSLRMPEESLQWAEEIKDAAVRKQALQMCLMSWAYKDGEKPAKWLEQAKMKMDEEMRKAIATWISPSLKARRSGQSHGSEAYLTEGIVIFR